MNSQNQTETLSLIANRAVMYRFLARLYREEADQELIETILKYKFPFEDIKPEIATSFKRLRGDLSRTNDDQVTELAVDFARLFLGAAVDGAFPYESVYTSDYGLIMQDAHEEMLALYRQAGLERAEGLSEPEDHIALQFEYMGHQCQQTISALQHKDDDRFGELIRSQRDFLKQHLLSWVDRLGADIERLARTDFYRSAAKITNRWLQIDFEILSNL